MGFFDNVDKPKDEEKQYIPPNYEDEDREIGEELEKALDEEESDVDEGEIETALDSQQKSTEESKKPVNNNTMANVFGQPSTSPPSGGGFGSSPFTPSFGSGSSPWQQRQQSSPWGTSGNSGSSIWGSGGNNTQKEPINRDKKIIFCDFLDCIVETYDSQGRPGYIPRDIYDLKPRFEVWQKLAAFNPKQIYAMIPVNLMPNTNGDESWIKTLEYFCCSLSAFLQIPPGSCRILAQTLIGQPKEDLISSILHSGLPIGLNDVIYIGIYSGLAGQSNKDQVAAQRCGIDYLDLGMLLNNMY